MPKRITIQRTTVPQAEREKYFERLKARREHYTNASCRFWVFEELSLPGAFVEFIEADDEAALISAHTTAPHRVLDPARVYKETEIG